MADRQEGRRMQLRVEVVLPAVDDPSTVRSDPVSLPRDVAGQIEALLIVREQVPRELPVEQSLGRTVGVAARLTKPLGQALVRLVQLDVGDDVLVERVREGKVALTELGFRHLPRDVHLLAGHDLAPLVQDFRLSRRGDISQLDAELLGRRAAHHARVRLEERLVGEGCEVLVETEDAPHNWLVGSLLAATGEQQSKHEEGTRGRKDRSDPPQSLLPKHGGSLARCSLGVPRRELDDPGPRAYSRGSVCYRAVGKCKDDERTLRKECLPCLRSVKPSSWRPSARRSASGTAPSRTSTRSTCSPRCSRRS